MFYEFSFANFDAFYGLSLPSSIHFMQLIFAIWMHSLGIVANCDTWKLRYIWIIIQSINQFYFLLSATSSMPLALYIGTHTLRCSLNTYIYIYSEIQHTCKHSYKAAISAQIQCFYFRHSHSWTLRAAYAFLILGNPSLVLKSPPGVPASTAPLTTYVNSAARGAAFSLQVETNPDLLRDRQAG